MKRKAIIISISGTKLAKKDEKLIKREKPWGLILFKRNISNFIQTKRLIKSIRVANTLIDQILIFFQNSTY